MSCKFQYNDIYQQYGALLRQILLHTDSPYPVYESKEEYDEDTDSEYKGILIWNSRKYHATITDVNDVSDDSVFENNTGFFVVPTFGNVLITPNVEYKQLIVITVDTNGEPDYDPFGTRTIEWIDWFINQYMDMIESIGMTLPSGTKIFSNLDSIIGPTDGKGSYSRRSITIVVRYCRC